MDYYKEILEDLIDRVGRLKLIMYGSVAVIAIAVIVAVNGQMGSIARAIPGLQFFVELPPEEEKPQKNLVDDENLLETPHVKAIEVSYEGLIVRWDEVPDAEAYRIYRKTGTGDWKKLGDTTDLAILDTKVEDEERYVYTVCCVNEKGTQETSRYNTSGKSATFFLPITGLKAENEAFGVKVSWPQAKGTEWYKVYRRTVNDGWEEIGEANSLFHIDTTAKSGKKYWYAVSRMDDLAEEVIGVHDPDGVGIKYIEAPRNLQAYAVAGGAKITWKKSKGAKKYRVYKRTDKGDWVRIGETTKNSFIDTSLKTGVNRTYTVRCVSEDGKRFTSSFNRVGITIVFVKAPSNIKAEAKNGCIEVTWKGSDGASKYRVYRKSKGSDWKEIGDVKETHFTDKDIEGGVLYTYTVCCLDSAGEVCSGSDEKGASALYLAPIMSGDLTIEIGESEITISWPSIEGATSYNVMRKTDGGEYKKIGDTKETTYKDKKPEGGVTYIYAVKPRVEVDGKEYFGESEGKKAVVLGAVSVSGMSSESPTTMKVSWSSAKGASGYQIQWSKNANFDGASSAKVSETSKKLSDLASDTTYYVRVRAYKKSGDKEYYSDWSEAKSAKTQKKPEPAPEPKPEPAPEPKPEPKPEPTPEPTPES